MLKRRTLLQTALAAPLFCAGGAACATMAAPHAAEPYPAPVPDPDFMLVRRWRG